MTKQDRIDMEHEAEAYAEKYKTASPQEQSLIALAYLDGLKHGLKQHAHDYLVKTIELKRKYEEQIEKMKRHCNCKHRDSEGYCEIKRTYLIDLSYDGCDKWELED